MENTTFEDNIKQIVQNYEAAVKRGIATPTQLYAGALAGYITKFITKTRTEYGLDQFKDLMEPAYNGIVIAESCKSEKLFEQHLDVYHKMYELYAKDIFESTSSIDTGDGRIYDYYPRFLNLVTKSLYTYEIPLQSSKSLQLVSNITNLNALTDSQKETLIRNALVCAKNITDKQEHNISNESKLTMAIDMCTKWLTDLSTWTDIKKELQTANILGTDIINDRTVVKNIIAKCTTSQTPVSDLAM